MRNHQAAPSGPIDIYARVSRKGDKQQRSTTGQVAACRAVLGDRGLPAGEALVDDGRSAWNPRVTRPGWDALMARLESGEAGGVVVFDLERFTRQPSEGERLIVAAERGLLVLDSDAEFDLTTASGKKSFRDAMAAAAYYSDRLSDRVRRGKAAKARNGEVDAGVTRRPFGFEPDGVTRRDDEARLLADLTEHFLHGDAQDALIAWLNRRGVLTSHGGQWTKSGFKALLTRERNRGNLVHNGAVVARLPGEPIVDGATFDRVLAMYAARSPGRPPSPQYLCTTVAVCGTCGTPLGGRPRTGMRPYDDGQVKREYFCSVTGHPGACGRNAIDQRALDYAAREITVEVLSDPAHAAQIAAEAASRDEEETGLAALIAADEALALEIAGRLGRREITLKRHDAIMGPLDKRLAALRAALDDLGVRPARAPGNGDVGRTWDAALPEERRSMLRTALRGRRLVVGPADPSNRSNVARRLSIGD